MENFLSIFAIFALGFVFGWVLREEMAKRRVDRLMEQLGEDLKQVADDMINIKIERNGDFYYVFDKETDAFMGQATNRDDLEKALAEKFPGKRFAATPENLKEVGFAK